MTPLQIAITAILLVGGLFFLAVSSIGIVRLPDFYCRNHAVGQSETLGSMLVLAALALYNGLDYNSLKLLLILVFIAIANPTATHVVASAAHRLGLEPWSKGCQAPGAEKPAGHAHRPDGTG